MIEIRHPLWTAKPEHLDNGFIPLFRARLSEKALSCIESLCPGHESAAKSIAARAFDLPHAQRIRLPKPVGLIHDVLVIPTGTDVERVFVRHPRRVQDLTESFRAAGRIGSLPTAVLGIGAMAAWRLDASLRAARPQRRSIFSRALDAHERGVHQAWAEAMCSLQAAGLPEAMIIRLTAHFALAAIDAMTRSAHKVVRPWMEPKAREAAPYSVPLWSLVQLRNRTQAARVFPQLDHLRPRSWTTRDPRWEQVDAAIELGRPLVPAVMDAYGISRPVVETLWFRWPEPKRDPPLEAVDRLTRLNQLAPEALPDSPEQIARLEALLDGPLTDLGDAVLRSQPDGCTGLLLDLLRGDHHHDLLDYTRFLCEVASLSGIDAVDGKISLRALIGRPTLSQFQKRARAWHRIEDMARRAPHYLFARDRLGQSWSRIPEWPLPLSSPVEIDGTTFTFLGSRDALMEEGQIMRHCVAGYAADAAIGRLSIYHVSAADGEMATLALQAAKESGQLRFAVGQLRGVGNASCSSSTHQAAQRFVAGLNDRSIGIDPDFMKWIESVSDLPSISSGTVPPHSFTRIETLLVQLVLHGPHVIERYRACLTFPGPQIGSVTFYEHVRQFIKLGLADPGLPGDNGWSRLLA